VGAKAFDHLVPHLILLTRDRRAEKNMKSLRLDSVLNLVSTHDAPDDIYGGTTPPDMDRSYHLATGDQDGYAVSCPHEEPDAHL
jgi:hypothetical protein